MNTTQQITGRVRPLSGSSVGPEVDVRSMMMTVRRGVWKIALIVLLAVGLAAYSLSQSVPLFTAKVLVALDSRKSNVVNFESVMTGVQNDYSTLQLQSKIITSRVLMERVMDELNLERDPEFNSSLREPDNGPVAMLRRGVGWAVATLRDLFDAPAEPGRQSTEAGIRAGIFENLVAAIDVATDDFAPVFTISVSSESPEKAAQIANTVANEYILDQLEAKYTATEQATLWLANRVAELKAKLENAEARLADYVAESNLPTEESLTVINAQILDFRKRLTDLRSRAESVIDSAPMIEQLLEAGDVVSAARALPDPSAAVNQRLRDIDRSSPPYSPALLGQLETLVRADLERQRESVQHAPRNIPALEQAIADLEARRNENSSELIQLRELERETEATRTLYEYFLQRMNEISVQQGLQEADTRILSAALVPSSPTSPNVSATVLLALVGGLAFGLLYVLVREYFNNRVRTRSEVAGITDVPVIAEVPLAPASGRGRLLRVLLDRPEGRFSAAISSMRAAIMLSNIDRAPQVIMFCSSAPGEGKSSLSTAFAVTTARSRKRVLLIECDLRRPVMTEFFGHKRKRGDRRDFVSLLTGETPVDEAIQHHEASGIDILFAGRPRHGTMDLFSSEAFGNLITEMRQRYDFIVLDTPPVLAVPDGRVIANHADAMFLAVKWNSTTREALRASLAVFEQSRLTVAGIVLNHVDPRKMARHGYDYYGYSSINKYYAK